MRRLVLLLLGSCPLGCGPENSSKQDAPFASVKDHGSAQAERVAAARKVVEEAIAAHGGSFLNATPAGRIKVLTIGNPTPVARDEFVSTVAYCRPDQLRETVEFSAVVGADRRPSNTWTYLRDGKQAWKSENNGAFQTDADLQPIDDLFPIHLLRDLNAMRDGLFTIELVGDDPATRTVRATGLTRDVASSFEVAFDPTTRLIGRVSAFIQNPKTGRPGRSDSVFSNYRDFSGLKLPTTMIVFLDGERFVEKTLQEFTVSDRIEPAEFRPSGK